MHGERYFFANVQICIRDNSMSNFNVERFSASNTITVCLDLAQVERVI